MGYKSAFIALSISSLLASPVCVDTMRRGCFLIAQHPRVGRTTGQPFLSIETPTTERPLSLYLSWNTINHDRVNATHLEGGLHHET